MSLMLIQSSGKQLEVTLLAAGTVFILSTLLFLGPVALLIFCSTLIFMQTCMLSTRSISWIAVASFSLCLIFAEPAHSPYWSVRVSLLWSLLTTEHGWYHWLYASQRSGLSVAGGCLLACLVKLGLYLWQQSPFRRILHALHQYENEKVVGGSVQSKLTATNGSPASPSPDMTCLGVTRSYGNPIHLPDSSLNTHLLIAGTTGSGKTVTLLNLVESFIDRELPVLFIDGKGDLELKDTVMAYARYRHRKAWGFSMVGPSCKYNPLVGDYTALKDKIIALRKEWSEEHYLKLAEGYLQMVFKVLQSTSHTLTLVSASHMLDLSNLMSLVRTAVKNKQLTADQGQRLLNEIAAQEEATKHVESLKAELNNLANSTFRDLFDVGVSVSPDDVLEFPAVLRQKGVAYIALTPMIYPEVSGVMGRLLLNDLKSSLDPLAPQKVLLVIDEVSTLVSTQMLNFLNQGRYLGLHIILTVQSLADLGQKIPGNANLFIRQVLSNCNVFIMHKINDSEDAETLSNVLGTKLQIDHTAQVAEFGYETGLGSARLVHEYLAHPDQIKSLKRGQAFLFDKNEHTEPIAFLARKGLLVS